MEVRPIGVTDDQARRALEFLADATAKRGRKQISISYGTPSEKRVLVEWMYQFVRLSSENGVSSGSKIDALRSLSDGVGPGLGLQRIREELTDELENAGLVQSLNSRRTRLQVLKRHDALFRS